MLSINNCRELKSDVQIQIQLLRELQDGERRLIKRNHLFKIIK
jgi:hypothetical protein